MARTKKIKEEVKEDVQEVKTPDYGSGMTRINNMLQAGFRPSDPEVKGNE